MSRLLHLAAAVALLLTTGVLAVTSLRTDSVTWDETSHLTAGMSYIRTGDYRLAPDHPPLAKLWAALPVHLFVNHRWPPLTGEPWREANVFAVGRGWLFTMNDPQVLIVPARIMIVVLLLATNVATYALARRLFGRTAGLLALTLAAFSPTLLAHGRLVTTDLPITLLTCLTLLSLAAVLRRPTALRLLAAAASLAAASVTKLSWPLILPAVLVMCGWYVAGNRAGDRPLPEGERAGGRAERRGGAGEGGGAPRTRGRRAAAAVGLLTALGVATWFGIWATYGFRFSILNSGRGECESAQDVTLQRLALDWVRAIQIDNAPRPGLVPAFLRLASARNLLPEAYLLGLAQTYNSSSQRSAYLMGEYSLTGWPSYFPIALAIKTPIGTLLLIVAGLAALVLRRARAADPVLLAGVITFIAVYAVYVVFGHLNIGHRHLLPVYPLLFVLAGAAAAWLRRWAGRVLVGACLLWLAGANLSIYPNYLAYFNELIGGPARGHLYLADSNIDWGQDLLRLAKYAREHPNEEIKLAYFGSALPCPSYLECTALPSYLPFGPPAELGAGTYVASVTQFLGVYDPTVRDEFWTPDRLAGLRDRERSVAAALCGADPDALDPRQVQALREIADLRLRLLLNRLRHRPPDERVGYSLFLHRLTREEVERLSRP